MNYVFFFCYEEINGKKGDINPKGVSKVEAALGLLFYLSVNRIGSNLSLSMKGTGEKAWEKKLDKKGIFH